MKKYILDTNICIYIIKKQPLNVVKKLKKIEIRNIGISSITLSELEYGVEKSSKPEQNKIALIEFISALEIYNYDDICAKEYGIIRTYLEKKGKIIGSMDLLIAAHVKALGHILVTNNAKEFKRVPDLKIENWV